MDGRTSGTVKLGVVELFNQRVDHLDRPVHLEVSSKHPRQHNLSRLFHPESVSVVRVWVRRCLPLWQNMNRQDIDEPNKEFPSGHFGIYVFVGFGSD